METAKMVLAYIKTLLSWPVVSAVLLLYLIKSFKVEIKDFLNRLYSFDAAGVSMKASPQEQPKGIEEEHDPVRALIGEVSTDASSSIETSKEINEEHETMSEEAITKYIVENPEKVKEDYINIFKQYIFERAFNIIYGTQIRLLEHLMTKGTEGESYINLHKFYNEFLKLSNSALTQMDDYIGFLKEFGFVTSYAEKIVITQEGADFLSYIQRQYPFKYKNKVF